MLGFSKKLSKTRFSSIALIIIIGVEIVTGTLMVYSLQHLFRPSRVSQQAPAPDEISLLSNPAAAAPLMASETFTIGLTTIGSSGLAPDIEMALATVFGPLPAYAETEDYEVTDELINLGRNLWYDSRLSADNSMSCNTCHALENYGVDNLTRSQGIDGTLLHRNTPTVYNAALHIAQFWDGRSATVEEQAAVPILAANEMGMLRPERVNAIFGAIPDYRPLFAAAFPEDPNPINITNIVIAIGAFERGLLTPSRFDLFLQGDYSQLTEEEQRGMATFVTLRCPSCHIGSTLGGLSFKRLGEHEPYFPEDTGRYQVTGQEIDRFVFKVPGLRNVAETAPYLHDGSIETLDEVVRFMVRHQLGKTVTDAEVADVVAFLESLTGTLPVDYIAKPQIPGLSSAPLNEQRDR